MLIWFPNLHSDNSKQRSAREQIRRDLLTLIQEERLEGYTLILMMDANGDEGFAGEITHNLRMLIPYVLILFFNGRGG